ncbi:tRNA (adenosine(37)-N6)-threonylcarbamoyltransferase complex ATPase subunit type 1 TsaE [Arthrobacter gandavensis]|uniref:tRNA (adenosine(37)-N6)-threonylcarbamoyltransferase complex ATPase subunit type 1 TsaE n=1 Tax=Arthrobacter gandavensis TaxID=169960 RepID=UPI00188FCC90|nr:tRNA (adenosine(37)-N6)-threonylcarbamoyltransferase complex ATPase subunit type 1 TsaE [Arthrobacter gandavensis]MBF4993840.1 tRNA (adenosine(37)-N6)-threonylcarbamoyltransferase complex ATPase subunit type 1 TsaE [Arthrobacter gandavensis]
MTAGCDVPAWELEYKTSSAAQTQELARTLGGALRAGDLLLLTGELGAGKTTFTQGLGEGLGVRQGIISPTFVLVRIHPALGAGPDLVHVDAYRLGSAAEIDDIDLENTLDSSVTVVEWGHGLVEHLSESRLEVTLLRATGGESAGAGELVTDFSAEDDDEERTIRIAGYGPRWAAGPVPVP